MALNKTPATRLYQRFSWWGGSRHKFFTVVVFIILASLDNAARGVFPPLYAVMARDLDVPEASLGLISAVSILVVAASALLWGYWGDRHSRKPLLLYGTLIWSIAMLLTGFARTYSQLMIFQLITAVGIGSIAAVGFSVVSDLIPPVRRGLAMSFWGLSQGGGGGAGALLGGMLGAYFWPLPFFLIAGLGLIFAILYLFSFEPERGRSEPELAHIFESGKTYAHRIQWSDIRRIVTNRSNQWLIVIAFLVTITYGSLIWMPRLFISRVEAAGYSLETATVSGNLLSLLFQTGFYFAILAGYLGDRWQRKSPGGRAKLCTIAVLVAVPFQIAVFFMPLLNLDLPEEGGVVAITLATLVSIFTNPWVTVTFILALVAVAFSSADTPNRNAILTDVNLPEHRGTAVGLLTIAIGIGVATGNALAGLTFSLLGEHVLSPLNFAIGLAIFQLLLIPAGLVYFRLAKTTANDTAAVKQTLRERAGSK